MEKLMSRNLASWATPTNSSWQICSKRTEPRMTVGMASTITSTSLHQKELMLNLSQRSSFFVGALTARPSRRKCFTHLVLTLSREPTVQTVFQRCDFCLQELHEVFFAKLLPV